MSTWAVFPIFFFLYIFSFFFLFFFNVTATTEIYTLSLHDALPIYPSFSTPSRLTSLMEPVDRIKLSIEFLLRVSGHFLTIGSSTDPLISVMDVHNTDKWVRSEEHTSELQSRPHISYAVFCLKKKKNKIK